MEKVWLKSYPEGIPAEVNTTEYNSVVEIFEESCRKFASRSALKNFGHTLTYAQYDQFAKTFASYLQNDLGLKKGDRIALMLPNILQYPIALYGAMRAGLIIVNVNPLYTASELSHQINDSGAQTIIILSNFASILEEALPDIRMKNIIITEMGDMLGFPKRILMNFIVKHVKKMIPAYTLPNAVSFTQAMKIGMTKNFRPVALQQSDTLLLQYTGGTTGVSKGAELTHGNLVANLTQVSAWVANVVAVNDTQEFVVTAIPLYHIFAFTANLLTFTKLGGCNLLITNPRDMKGFIKELKKNSFTIMTGVNTLYNGLLNHPDFASLDFSALRLCLGGGMAMQKSVTERWAAVTKTPIIEAYGLTETSPAVCINPVTLDVKPFRSAIGLPLPSTDISIRDDKGNELGVGEIGELCVRGPQVMRGYWNRPESNTEAFTEDGYVRTGDIATVAEDGFVSIVDRKKDMIIVSGFNVYPNEVEDVIARLDGVLEAAVIGVPSNQTGEAVKAFIVKKDPALTEETILDYCHKYLTRYKVPKIIEFRKDLPKSPVGKILRKNLRQQ